MVVQIGPKFIGNYKVHVNEIICSQYYFDNLKKKSTLVISVIKIKLAFHNKKWQKYLNHACKSLSFIGKINYAANQK